MPEISINLDDRGKSQFVFRPLQGEEENRFSKTALLVEVASSYISIYKKLPGAFGSDKNIRKANGALTKFLPDELAADLIQALMNNKVGTKLIFTSKGETEEDGFELQSFESPQK